MNKIYIGIDPGQKGGIAMLIPNQKPILHKMPLIESELDLEKLLEYIDPGSYSCHIIIENVHSIFGTSAASNFSFGFGCGQLFATLKLSGIPFTQISPKVWQKEIWQGVKPIEILDSKKKTKDGKPKYKIDTKATSLLAVIRLFPGIDLRGSDRSKKEHDGIVDALCLAEYGRRKNY
jgi:hypothetical protein